MTHNAMLLVCSNVLIFLCLYSLNFVSTFFSFNPEEIFFTCKNLPLAVFHPLFNILSVLEGHIIHLKKFHLLTFPLSIIFGQLHNTASFFVSSILMKATKTIKTKTKLPHSRPHCPNQGPKPLCPQPLDGDTPG